MKKIIFLCFLFLTACVLPGREITAIFKKGAALQRSKGALAAARFYIAQADRPEISMTDTRKLLNYAAAPLIRADRELAFQCLRRALVTPCRNPVEVQRTFVILGRCYAAAGCPRRAIGACMNVASSPKSSHPSLTYSAWYTIGLACMNMKQYKEARHAFSEAIKSGKRVPYRFNYKPAEKMLERIKNK